MISTGYVLKASAPCNPTFVHKCSLKNNLSIDSLHDSILSQWYYFKAQNFLTLFRNQHTIYSKTTSEGIKFE